MLRLLATYLACTFPGIVVDARPPHAIQTPATRTRHALSSTTPRAANGTTAVYLANGCFWERQWAYYVVETTTTPFGRAAIDVSSKVGYAGGHPSAVDTPGPVCYHSGDERDYSTLGMAEAVRVVLDESRASDQMRVLSRDFFDSFTGPAGQRARPDAGDVGTPYRSMVGLPGGNASALYAVFAAENTLAMALKPGVGGDADELNTVWVYDSTRFPFYDGERYHQAHCNFFASEGMPYPASYTGSLWTQKATDGGAYANLWQPTGCPEGVMPHPGQLCDAARFQAWG
tara:strand:- start:55 stop:915 length:861 start_codon:yes stop_codon:yes gene_type:complete